MYYGVVIAPDGDYVIAYEGKTKEEVIEQLTDRGSRWYFYPFEVITTDKMAKVVDAPDDLNFAKGKSFSRLIKAFQKAIEIIERNNIEYDIFEYISIVKNIFTNRKKM